MSNLAQRLPFVFGEHRGAGQVGDFTPESRHVKDAPGDDHVDRQTVGEPGDCSKLPLLDEAPALERAVIDLDPPSTRVPVDLLHRLRERAHLQGGQQHPLQRLDSVRRMFLARQHGPHVQGLAPRGAVAWRAQLHWAEAYDQARAARGTLGGAWHLHLTQFGLLLTLHHLPQQAAGSRAAHAAIRAGAHQQGGMVITRVRELEEFEDIRLTVADTHHAGVRAQTLRVRGCLEAGQPFVALLLFDGTLAAGVSLAELAGITRPHLDVQKSKRHAARGEGERVVYFETERTVSRIGDRAEPGGRRVRAVVERGSVLHRQHHGLVVHARGRTRVMWGQNIAHRDVVVIDQTVGPFEPPPRVVTRLGHTGVGSGIEILEHTDKSLEAAWVT